MHVGVCPLELRLGRGAHYRGSTHACEHEGHPRRRHSHECRAVQAAPGTSPVNRASVLQSAAWCRGGYEKKYLSEAVCARSLVGGWCGKWRIDTPGCERDFACSVLWGGCRRFCSSRLPVPSALAAAGVGVGLRSVSRPGWHHHTALAAWRCALPLPGALAAITEHYCPYRGCRRCGVR
jgi:hypothetical protein